MLVSLLPAGVSFTVTTGVAPLLFVQLLYGQMFYAATVLPQAAGLARAVTHGGEATLELAAEQF